MIGLKMRKIILQLLLMFCMLKMEKYILPAFQNITQMVKNKSFFNDSERGRMTLSCKKVICIIKKKNQFNAFIPWLQKGSLNHIKKYAKIKTFVIL